MARGTVKIEKQYEALRDKGTSNERVATIANSQGRQGEGEACGQAISHRGGAEYA
jgi:hypothetical protein